MKIFVSLARTVEDEKHDTTSTAGGRRSSQRRWVVKRPSPWPPEPRPEPMPGFGAMPPRGGGPLPSRSRSIPLPMMPLEPPGPRSLRLISRRSSPPLRVSRSRTALVFFSSTFRRTSPRNMMGCKEERMINTQGSKSFCGLALCCAWRFFGLKVTFALKLQKDQRQNTGVCSQKLWLSKSEFFFWHSQTDLISFRHITHETGENGTWGIGDNDWMRFSG